MNKPRIFLGSSGMQTKLVEAITRGLEDVADVEPWTTTFNPRRSTLDRLVELCQEVDFAAFVFAQDDLTTSVRYDPASPASDEPAVLDNGQPPNLVAGHQLERLFEVFVGVNTDEVPRVDVSSRRLGVCGLGDHSRPLGS
ncbi:MAG TPA: TIR domain-containing protein [Gaiellaceae bacterium]|nr:TIR domain-containing protein [Gaiellaceae bacterium]